VTKKRKQRARARQLRKARLGATRTTRRKSEKREISPQAKRWFTYIFWIGIALVLVGAVAVTYYYAVWRPSMERIQAPPVEEEEGMHAPAGFQLQDSKSQGDDQRGDKAVARGPKDDAPAGSGLWRDPTYRKG
jgi:type II secretory pathway component PulM